MVMVKGMSNLYVALETQRFHSQLKKLSRMHGMIWQAREQGDKYYHGVLICAPLYPYTLAWAQQNKNMK